MIDFSFPIQGVGLYGDYIGIMEKKMATAGIVGVVWGLYNQIIGLGFPVWSLDPKPLNPKP